ncbi:MAG: rubrerythrin family protein [Deltaproteobacteria bacterium]|nr:rubrerythrin family protein [Deltaproteobacteria bacterium]
MSSTETPQSSHRPPELEGTRTHEHLRQAYARDAQAARLWASFARVAEIEGFPEAARVLRDLAESEALHADGHLDLLARAGDPLDGAPLGETAANLRAAIGSQEAHHREVLAVAVGAARGEGFPDVASWFESVGHARAVHVERLRAVLAHTEGGSR